MIDRTVTGCGRNPLIVIYGRDEVETRHAYSKINSLCMMYLWCSYPSEALPFRLSSTVGYVKQKRYRNWNRTRILMRDEASELNFSGPRPHHVGLRKVEISCLSHPTNIVWVVGYFYE